MSDLIEGTVNTVDEKTAKARLTFDGYYAYENCFTVYDILVAWSPDEPGFGVLRFEDDSVYFAALALLKADDQVLPNVQSDTVRRFAKRHNWKNQDALDNAIEDLASYFAKTDRHQP